MDRGEHSKTILLKGFFTRPLFHFMVKSYCVTPVPIGFGFRTALALGLGLRGLDLLGLGLDNKETSFGDYEM